MSVFSRLKRSRDAAKQHQEKQEEMKKAEEAKTPYRHVPTHAALDALTGAPAGWNIDDKVRVVEENRRRSAMMAAGAGGTVPASFLHPQSAIPRVGSTLSYVSYPSTPALAAVQLPRSASYGGLQTSWAPRMPATPEFISSAFDPDGKGKSVSPLFSPASLSSESSGTNTLSTGKLEAERTAAYFALAGAGAGAGDSAEPTPSQSVLELQPLKKKETQAEQGPVDQSNAVENGRHLRPSRSRRKLVKRNAQDKASPKGATDEYNTARSQASVPKADAPRGRVR